MLRSIGGMCVEPSISVPKPAPSDSWNCSESLGKKIRAMLAQPSMTEKSLSWMPSLGLTLMMTTPT